MAFLQQAPRRAAASGRHRDRDEQRESRQTSQQQRGGGGSSSSTTTAAAARGSRSGSNSSGHSNQEYADRGGGRDWSIVFPGRASRHGKAPPAILEPSTRSDASDVAATTSYSPPTPFLDDDEVDGRASPTAPLAPLHDGTGRFTRPPSPADLADNEDNVDGDDDDLLPGHRRPSHWPTTDLRAPLSDSITLGSLSEGDELDFGGDMDSIGSSALFSETESEHRERHTRRTRRASSIQAQGAAVGSAHAPALGSASTSWAWMQNPEHRSASMLRAETDLPVVLTSDSEGEEQGVARAAGSSKYTVNASGEASALSEWDDIAFEEALANTHWAQSAGLRARVPKRRHRRSGESEKGSKRSNNSAAVASDLRSASALRETRRGLSSRRSAASAASARARVRHHQQHGMPEPAPVTMMTAHEVPQTPRHSAGQRLVGTLLRRVLGVDDEDVLAAFLRNEGPLHVDESHDSSSGSHAASTAAVMAAAAQRGTLGVRADTDDVWSRNQRHRRMRLLMDGSGSDSGSAGRVYGAVNGEDKIDAKGWRASEDSDGDDDEDVTTDAPTHKRSAHAAPQRAYVSGNVAEPSLVEALQASVFSGLRVLPSGLSILMAGSHSVRLVNYIVGRIGPSLTERVRKLLDDEEGGIDDIEELHAAATTLSSSASSTSATSRARSATMASDSSVRFFGSAHPALSTCRRGGGDNPATA